MRSRITSVTGPQGIQVSNAMVLTIEADIEAGGQKIQQLIKNIVESAIKKADKAIIIIVRPHNSGLVAAIKTKMVRGTSNVSVKYVGPYDLKHQGALNTLNDFMDEVRKYGF